MLIVGIILLVLVAYLLRKWAKDPAYANFKLIYCITNKSGYPDNAKMREWVVFFVTTYGFLWMLWGIGMTEWYYVGYGSMWVLAAGYALKKRAEQNPLSKPTAQPKEGD